MKTQVEIRGKQTCLLKFIVVVVCRYGARVETNTLTDFPRENSWTFMLVFDCVESSWFVLTRKLWKFDLWQALLCFKVFQRFVQLPPTLTTSVEVSNLSRSQFDKWSNKFSFSNLLGKTSRSHDQKSMTTNWLNFLYALSWKTFNNFSTRRKMRFDVDILIWWYRMGSFEKKNEKMKWKK